MAAKKKYEFTGESERLGQGSEIMSRICKFWKSLDTGHIPLRIKIRDDLVIAGFTAAIIACWLLAL